MQLGVIGLGTMGANLARNAARNGVDVHVFNRTTEKMEAFMAAHGKEGKFTGHKTVEELVAGMAKPRAILLMVKAGSPVDDLIEELLPVIDKGDILIDAGNSHYRDTERRLKRCMEKSVHFVGMGVSGGEQGALLGPSMMPGGDMEAVKILLPMLTPMSAEDGNGGRCVSYVGPGGSGHFVKMVHNGIEYGVMQLIAEAYHLLQKLGGLNNEQLQQTFTSWNGGYLQGYLMEITALVFKQKDDLASGDLIDQIMDTAAQKGTGKWTVESGFEYAVSIPTITAAVDARIVSSGRTFRIEESKRSPLATHAPVMPSDFVELVRTALECSVINTYAQGWQLISAASTAEKWNLNLSQIARIWRGGCIIRSSLLPEYEEMFAGHQTAAERVRNRLVPKSQEAWRHVVTMGVQAGIPLPAISASLSYYDAYRTARLPSNLIAALRDVFGAHGYERLDRAGEFHAHWGA